jgi:hypothetical protein
VHPLPTKFRKLNISPHSSYKTASFPPAHTVTPHQNTKSNTKSLRHLHSTHQSSWYVNHYITVPPSQPGTRSPIHKLNHQLTPSGSSSRPPKPKPSRRGQKAQAQGTSHTPSHPLSHHQSSQTNIRHPPHRPSSQHHAVSSWTSNAPAASPSQPSSATPKP